MEEATLNVKMLGSFNMFYQDIPLIPENSRENKVLHFLEYLIAHRKRGIPQDELIEVILGNEDSANPVNILKNLVYRARKLFQDVDLDGKKYISNKNGVYGFTQSMPVTVDIEEFTAAATKAAETDDDDAAIQHALTAIKLYGGDFLPRSSGQIWTISLGVTYQDMFFDNVNRACRILLQRKKYNDVLAITKRALFFYPYADEFYVHRLTALCELGRVKEAIVAYETASAILFDELGVNPSKELHGIYVQATQGLEELSLTVQDILSEINEAEVGSGAYYCSYHMFANTCRFVSRHIERSGQSAFMILCVLSDREGKKLSPLQIKEVAKGFHKTTKTSLRRSDIYTRCSPSQFLVLLMGINHENCRMVSKRIEDTLHRYLKGDNVKLTSSIASVAVFPDEKTDGPPRW